MHDNIVSDPSKPPVLGQVPLNCPPEPPLPSPSVSVNPAIEEELSVTEE